MSKSAKIKFAIVGCGRIGKRYIQLLLEHPQTELVALIDVKSIAETGVDAAIPYFKSLEEFFSARIDADIIVIATPNGLHAEQATKCLEQGFHVLIEKPIALKAEDAQKIFERAEFARKYAFAVMQIRYAAAAKWLKTLIDAGELGKIYFVQVNCFWNRDGRYYAGHEWHGSKRLDGGPLFTQFAHFVDMLYWLFGDLINIQGALSNFAHKGLTDFEDTGVFSFQLAKGGMGSFNYTTAVCDQNFESSISIIGEKGTVKVSGQYMDTIEYCHLQNQELSAQPDMAANENNDHSSSSHHYALISDVVSVLLGEQNYHDDVLDGIAVVDIIERMNGQLKFSFKKSVV